jgi:hypothetical protein
LVENYYPELKNSIDIDTVRRNLLQHLLSKIELSSDSEKVYNVICTCIELYENKVILELVINDEQLMTSILNVLVINPTSEGSQEYNYTESLILLINILKLISIESLKVPGYITANADEDIVNSEDNKVLEIPKLGHLILKYLPEILKNFPMTNTENNIDGTFGMTFTPLGLRRVRIVELVFCSLNYFKNVPEIIDDVVLKTDFFKHFFVKLINFRTISLSMNGITFISINLTH